MSQYRGCDARTSADRGADLSGEEPTPVYRYRLWRSWDDRHPGCTWVMLNPSTADALVDDPTIVRCVNFARAWGFGRIDVFNLYALRATDPRELARHPDPIGQPDNDLHLLRYLAARPHGAWPAAGVRAHLVHPVLIAAWGVHGGDRGLALRRQLAGFRIPVHHIGPLTNGGHPRHPLYLRGDLHPTLMSPPTDAATVGA